MITSHSNPRVKSLISLMKKRKERDEKGVFLVEGIRMFREVPAEQVKEVYASASFYEKEKKTIEQVLAGSNTEVQILSDDIYARVSDTKTPQGILCVVRQMTYTLEDILAGKEKSNAHIMVLEHIQDPGNLGTIIRTAEGAGVTGIVMDGQCVDIYNPKVIRSTMGSIYRMPFLYTDHLGNVITQMKEQGIRVYAAHLEGKNSYDQEDYREPCAFLIGNEGNGLTDQTAAMSDCYVRIPMHGQVESLNAAIAASLLMFEVSRQRR